ncbi:hypothetical protein IPJ72_04755 [Candidatus Peregrinibacteria bacterium]|nr:MAG: hypothetical protein IPJ72_04755 [Candidatus Peregrinibacteria bacterium]
MKHFSFTLALLLATACGGGEPPQTTFTSVQFVADREFSVALTCDTQSLERDSIEAGQEHRVIFGTSVGDDLAPGRCTATCTASDPNFFCQLDGTVIVLDSIEVTVTVEIVESGGGNGFGVDRIAVSVVSAVDGNPVTGGTIVVHGQEERTFAVTSSTPVVIGDLPVGQRFGIETRGFPGFPDALRSVTIPVGLTAPLQLKLRLEEGGYACRRAGPPLTVGETVILDDVLRLDGVSVGSCASLDDTALGVETAQDGTCRLTALAPSVFRDLLEVSDGSESCQVKIEIVAP